MRTFTSLVTVLFCCVAIVAEEEKDLLPKPERRTERLVEGWRMLVDDRLLQPDNRTGVRALQLLEMQLANIRSLVEPDRLVKLQRVVIVLDSEHGRLKAAQYHPSAGWLTAHGYAAELARCVHIPAASNFADARHNREQPWCVMHELAHAYHDQVLGFDNAEIRQVFERYKAGGHGERVLFISGGKRKHYALTDHKEFFAEMTEAYFGTNDFFPFTRGELEAEEPEMYGLLVRLWGKGR